MWSTKVVKEEAVDGRPNALIEGIPIFYSEREEPVIVGSTKNLSSSKARFTTEWKEPLILESPGAKAIFSERISKSKIALRVRGGFSLLLNVIKKTYDFTIDIWELASVFFTLLWCSFQKEGYLGSSYPNSFSYS